MNNQAVWFQRLRAGDKTIFQELYAYFDYCTKPIRRFGGNMENAKDIFQEAIIVLYQKAIDNPNFKLNCQVKTYLYEIVRRLWLAHQKKKGNQVLPLLENYEQAVDLQDEIIERQKRQQEKYKESIAAIQQLAPQCQKILSSFYVHGLNLEEIAKALDIGKASVKTRKSQCFAQWRKLLNS